MMETHRIGHWGHILFLVIQFKAIQTFADSELACTYFFHMWTNVCVKLAIHMYVIRDPRPCPCPRQCPCIREVTIHMYVISCVN